MKRGANTFPFHNLLPYSESNKGLFLYFLPSLKWIKEKSVATLAIRTFAIQKSQSQFTVLHMPFILFALLAHKLNHFSTLFNHKCEEAFHCSHMRGHNS